MAKRFTPAWFVLQIKNHPVTVWLHSTRTLYIIGMDRTVGEQVASSLPFNYNSWDDLACFEQTERWLAREQFLAEARQRLDDGNCCVTLVEDGVLVYSAWYRPNARMTPFPHVGQKIEFPEGTATTYNSYSHPKARGRGIHTNGLRARVAGAFADPACRFAFAAIEPSNIPPWKAAMKVGFRHMLTLTTRRRLGRAVMAASLMPDAPGLALDAVEPGVWRLREAVPA